MTVKRDAGVFNCTDHGKYVTINLKVSASRGGTNTENATFIDCKLQLPIFAPCSNTIKSKLETTNVNSKKTACTFKSSAKNFAVTNIGPRRSASLLIKEMNSNGPMLFPEG